MWRRCGSWLISTSCAGREFEFGTHLFDDFCIAWHDDQRKPAKGGEMGPDGTSVPLRAWHRNLYHGTSLYA